MTQIFHGSPARFPSDLRLEICLRGIGSHYSSTVSRASNVEGSRARSKREWDEQCFERGKAIDNRIQVCKNSPETNPCKLHIVIHDPVCSIQTRIVHVACLVRHGGKGVLRRRGQMRNKEPKTVGCMERVRRLRL